MAYSHATIQTNFENNILGEKRQTKTTYYMIPFLFNMQNKHIHRDRKLVLLGTAGEETLVNDVHCTQGFFQG